MIRNNVELIRNVVSSNKLDNFLSEMSLFFNLRVNDFEDLKHGLIDIRNNDEEIYLNKMKVFSKSILVRNFIDFDTLTKIARNQGIDFPTQFSYPVLHISCNDLIPDKAKRGVKTHQDWPSQLGSLNSIVVWVPIYGADNSNGGLWFYGKAEPARLFNAESNGSVTQISEDALGDYKSEYFSVSPGDALVFNQLIPHKSLPNPSFRISISFRIEDGMDKEWENRNFEYAHEIKINRFGFDNEKFEEINNVIRKN